MKFLTLFLLSLVMNLAAYASHLRCGQIIVQQKASGSRTVKITIQVWTSYAANVLFGGDQDVLNFGDGTTLVIPETQNQIVPQFPDLGFATFTTEHTYASLGRYVVSYREPNRNAEVINFDNSVNTTMYLESEFNLFGDRKYTSPLPLASPYYYNYTSTALSRSVAAVDSNDFALRYVLVPLLADRSTQVLNYRRPTTMSLNQYEGLLTWDNTFFGQSLMGEYVIGMRIEQFIWTEAGWVRVGYVYRDYQIILADNNSFENTNIQTDQSITKIVVEENAAHTFRVFVPQPESSEYTIELNTELPEENYSLSVYDSVKDETTFKVAKITLSSTPDIIRNNPYIINVRFILEANEQLNVIDKNFNFFTKPVDFFEPLGPGIPTATDERDTYKTFTVHPNPTNGQVQIDGLMPNDIIRIYDAKGGFLLQCSVGAWRELDLTALPAGIYLIKAHGLAKMTRLVKL